MRIGIFGGSFNPPHKMHLRIALDLIDNDYLDKVIYVPTGSKYKYKNNLLPDKNRYEMLEIMTKDDERLLVSDFELKDKVVYTYETLEYFRSKYPSDEIYFVCGLDNLSYIDKWKNSENLLNNKFLVIKRSGDNFLDILNRLDKYKENIVITDVVPSDLSSTMIRERIKNNDDVLDYVDYEILNYIKENKLYEA